MNATAADVRHQMINALRLDLVGPRNHTAHLAYAEEVLPSSPSRWYLTGFLAPYESSVEQRADDDGDDALDQSGHVGPGDDETTPEQTSARKAFFPSSMGLSVLIDKTTTQLTARVCWGEYTRGSGEGADGRGWTRRGHEATTTVDLPTGVEQVRVEVPESGGLYLVAAARPVSAASRLPEGTRAISVFLLNQRPPAPDVRRDEAFVFQPDLELTTETAFVPRQNPLGWDSNDWDEQVADLQYRDASELAVGHNVSAVAVLEDAICRTVRTCWLPTADVEKVIPRTIDDVELGMEALAAAPSADAINSMVGPMITGYASWIGAQRKTAPTEPTRARVAGELIDNADRARKRIEAGLATLADPTVLRAFQIANRCIARAIRQRETHGTGKDPASLAPPTWRPFQLAFLLMNLPAVASSEHPDREAVDLLFFPTGGGKTEAYLGLAAVAMVLRRLRDPSIHSAGLTVLMRYTLRLLTLDQLGRAATLICALELERQQDIEALGHWPFEIGLWVGQSATPNRIGKKGDKDKYSARSRTLAFQNDTRKPSPIPLENCPWCGAKFGKDSFTLLPNPVEPTDLRVTCSSRKCDFHGRRQPGGLPVLSVDEPIYRRLPAFIIATVDKFANLPWVGETAGIFGRVERHDSEGFYGPWRPGAGQPLDKPLPPPDLVIQDELHLISGPLGTMVGLYETAIDALCEAQAGARPKIVASTATVRRAEKQIRGLFGRNAVDIFPPPGPDRRDSYFARTVDITERNARTYIGVAAQGRNLKVVLLRTALALLAAGQKAWLEHGGDKNPQNPADPYMTLLGYFSSLRELGGSRRIIEDEVRARLTDYAQRRRRGGEQVGLFADRKKLTEPRELTSRVGTNEVADTKRRLALPFHEKERVDVALATNMISVGLDISRLGLMVVLGQPKSAAEYIQATSRVGRDDKRPGLVVTLLNVHRPRDRSHYERFAAWHESFYRAVEATSVTPFSPRAIDRGIAGVTVALARLGHAALTAPRGASAITTHRKELEFVVEALSRRAEAHDKDLTADEAEALRQTVRKRVEKLLDTWQGIADSKGELQYQREVGVLPPLLFTPLDPELAKQPKAARMFKAHRSLRDVEQTVNLWLRNPEGFEMEAGA